MFSGHFPSAIFRDLPNGCKPRRPRARFTTMTEPTRDKVKRMLDEGQTVRDIAYALRISTQAVYKHKRRIAAEGNAT